MYNLNMPLSLMCVLTQKTLLFNTQDEIIGFLRLQNPTFLKIYANQLKNTCAISGSGKDVAISAVMREVELGEFETIRV